jgi:hypothetical protein
MRVCEASERVGGARVAAWVAIGGGSPLGELSLYGPFEDGAIS